MFIAALAQLCVHGIRFWLGLDPGLFDRHELIDFLLYGLIEVIVPKVNADLQMFVQVIDLQTFLVLNVLHEFEANVFVRRFFDSYCYRYRRIPDGIFSELIALFESAVSLAHIDLKCLMPHVRLLYLK